MRTLNLGILAHVDAGKTSLTERLLHAAGAIDAIGSVDDGNTQTDTLELERRRGITIKAAVVSFVVGDTRINLIDTPGHPDFIAEVERVLDVLDGAVLVVSAVEGVQAQTRVLYRALQRLGLPVLLFINKLDRRGADAGRTLAGILARLTPRGLPMGTVHDLGTPAAGFIPYQPAAPEFRQLLLERLAEADEGLLAAFVGGEPVSDARLCRALRRQSRSGRVHPVFLGSAITGAGIAPLLDGITRLLPSQAEGGDGPPAGTVFKVERGSAGERIAYVRMFAGTLRLRQRLPVGGREQRVTAIGGFEGSRVVRRDTLSAGEIGKLWGLQEVRIGDAIGNPPRRGGAQHFAPPTLETAVVARSERDRDALWLALGRLAEQDPLVNLRRGEATHETWLSLYGEVQKDIIGQTLREEHGLEVEFRETTMICIERPVATGAALETIFRPPNPFLATIGLRVEPAEAGTGVTVRLEAMFGAMPVAFYEAIELAVGETLQQGLCGWRVTDCLVSITDAAQKAPMSTAGDFRNLTPMVLMQALAAAGTVVCEPVHRFRLECPADALAAVLAVLARLRATPEAPVTTAGVAVLEGGIAAAQLHALQQQLPGVTRGEGVLESGFDGYRPVAGPPPLRPRSGADPLNRQHYLAQFRGLARG